MPDWFMRIVIVTGAISNGFEKEHSVCGETLLSEEMTDSVSGPC